MKVGELARRTGLTVRTLHHYDEIGLLSPSTRTEAGHRLYSDADVLRLQQIASLRQFGLPLDEIRELLAGRDRSALPVIEMHIARVRDQVRLQQRLLGQLDQIAGHLRRNGTAPVDELLRAMEMMTMVNTYYSEEQLEWLRKRREEVGEDRIREVEAEWPRLMAEVRAEMVAGTDPADPKLQPLLDHWGGLVAEFTGGNDGIAQSLTNLFENEDSLPDGQQIDRELFAYVGKAMAARNP
ncbi:MAG TPA: MerR family transcriptional regulator [Thermomicrobiales bacterium]|nr:MerR family transcriptional regulator [Thermomicrobiales bacterium]